MRNFICSIILLFASLASFSQESGEVVRDNKVYKIHIVEAGNTLYGLHNKYGVEIDDIIKENPEAANGLRIGQKLYIPTGQAPTYTKVHIVEKKETLFGISRQYNCSVDKLIELNPGVENGLSIGQELKVPDPNADRTETVEQADQRITEEQDNKTEDSVRYEVDFSDSVITYEVKDGETLYSISRRFMVPVKKLIEDNDIRRNKIKPGQEIKIALKKERIEKVEVKPIAEKDTIPQDTLSPTFEIKDNYNVAVLLPLRLQENGDALSGMYDEDTRLDQLTDISLDFLMGVQLALDSLEQLGLNASVQFYDTRGDIERLNSFFESEEARELDLVVGPFYPNLIEKTAEWCKLRKVRMVAVTKIPMKILKNNPYVYSVVPSELTLIAAMAEYVAKVHYDDNLFIISSKDDETKSRIELFKSVYAANAREGASKLKLMGVGNSSGRELFNAIDEDTVTLYICLENEIKSIMNFVNTLNAAKNYSPRVSKAKVYLVGTQEWLDYEAFNSYYRNRFKFHYSSSNYLNYDADSTVSFVKHYRSKFDADPTRYSVHGFDVMLQSGAKLLLGLDRSNGIMDHFAMSTLRKGHGYENMSAFISKQDEFEIHLLDIIENSDYIEETSAGDNQ